MSPERRSQADDRGIQERIAADLRAQILSGDIPTGHKIPSTAQLMQAYGVENKTVQAAVTILKEEGFLKGRAGSGVYVTLALPQVVKASHHPTLAGDDAPYPWITDAASRGRQGRADLIEVGEQPAPAQVAAAFSIATGDPVIVRHQLLRLDEQPAELVWLYYPVELGRGTPLAEHRKIKGGSPRVLAELGHPLGRAVDQVSARVANGAEYLALNLPKLMPVLRQFRVVYSRTGMPVEASVQVKAGQMYELQYELPAPAAR